MDNELGAVEMLDAMAHRLPRNGWGAATNGAHWQTLNEAANQAAEVAQLYAELSEYLAARGRGDSPEQAERKAANYLKTIRRAMGYTHP